MFFSLIGCATLQNPPTNINALFREGAKIAVIQAIGKDEDLVKPFLVVATVLTETANSGELYDSEKIKQILRDGLAAVEVPDYLAQYTEGALSVVFSGYEKFIRVNAQENLTEPAKQVILSVANGIRDGLANFGSTQASKKAPKNPLEDIDPSRLKL